MRDLIPPALTRAPPSYGACGGARTGTRTRPQRRYAPIAQDCTGSPQRRRSRQPVGRIRAGTLSLLYRPLQTFTEEIAPRYPGNRPHARPCVRRSVKLYTLDRKPRPKPARSRREHLYTLAKTPIAFISCSCRFDHTDFVRGACLGFNTPNALTLALRATQFARLEPVCLYRRERLLKSGRCCLIAQHNRSLIILRALSVSRPGAIFCCLSRL